MIKMIIIGVSGLVVAVGLTVGVMFFLNKNTDVQTETADATADSTKAIAEHTPSHDSLAIGHTVTKPELPKIIPQQDSTHDSANDTALSNPELSEGDMHAIDNIMANLQSIDVPTDTASAEPTNTTTPTSTSTKTNDVAIASASVTDTSAFTKKETSLVQREKQLDERQKSLEKREQEIARKMLVIDQAQSSRVASLAKLYDSMEPSQAAQVMQGIDDETIVLILPRMKTQNAAAVLGEFPPERASLLSMKMISIADDSK